MVYARRVRDDPVALLAGALGGERAAGLDERAVRAYADALARAQGEWPGIVPPPADLAAWMAERLPPEAALADAVTALRVGDVFIACACAAGDRGAIVAFEQRYFAEVALAVKRVARAGVAVDDVKQLVRERLFVGDGTRGPRIVEYRGTGAIRAWLRITASRIALNLATRGPRETAHDADFLADLAASDESSELSLLKQKYRVEFRAAVQTALHTLEPADQNLLRHVFAQGLSIDRIGAMYGIHRATAARRVTRARELFVEETKRALGERLRGASPGEVESIIGLIRSHFDVTLGGFLRELDVPDPPGSRG